MEKAEKTSDFSADEVSSHDGIVEYASEVLTLGLLPMGFDDAICGRGWKLHIQMLAILFAYFSR